MTDAVDRRRFAWLGLLFLSLAWGTSFLFTRLALEAFPPSFLVAGRIGVAACALNAVRLGLGLPLPRDAATWLRFLVFALTGSVVPFLLISWGQVEVSSGLAGILLTTSPLVTVAFAHFMVPEERATPRRLIGLAIGLVGVAVLLGPPSLEGLGSSESLVRQIAILAGAACYALNTTLVRRSASLHPIVYGSGVMLLGAPLSLVIAGMSEGTLPTADPLANASVLWLGIVPTGLATLVHFRVVAAAGPSFTSITSYLVPVVAAVAGLLVFDETLTPSTFVAFGLLAAGIALGQARAPRRLVPRSAQGSFDPVQPVA